MDDVEINEADSDSVGQVSQTGSNYISPFMYSPYKMREGIAKYVSSTGQLYTSAERVRFERFIKEYVQPQYSSSPLSLIRSDCLHIFNEKKRKLIAELGNYPGTISFTCSFWSGSDNLRGFLCVTAHYIDSAWLMQKRTIAFRMLEYPHSDAVIVKCIMDILREYLVEKKGDDVMIDILSYDVAIDVFRSFLDPPEGGQFSHMRCLFNMINSVVQEGLKLMEAHIEKIRKSILFIAARKEQFSEFCQFHDLKPRKFKHDISTHWNSTFLMLQSCVNYSDAITDFCNAKPGVDNLCKKDWELSIVFMEFLGVFNEVATSLSSNVYASSSCYGLGHLYEISGPFSKYRDHLEFKEIYGKMETKFKNYCESMFPVFSLAASMDPRFKVHGAEKIVNVISRSLNMPVKTDAKSLETLLHGLYKVYESRFGEKEEPKSDESRKRKYDIHAEYIEYLKQQDVETYGPTELHKYLGKKFAGCMTRKQYVDLDVIAWWKSYEGEFPVLSIMARDLLTPPVSAMAPEFVFSVAGEQVLDQRRSMQSPAMLDCSFCMKDWEDAQFRAQNWKDEMMLEYFADSDEGNIDESMMI